MSGVRRLHRTEFPAALCEIPDAPQQLYLEGELPDVANHMYLAVVGSRDYTPYGKQACERLIEGLAGYPVVIVSGLALGIDSIAHKKALDVDLPTIAIPGSGLDSKVLYPACHRTLAKDIVSSGGALLSEFDPLWKPRRESFPQRNRIMAGLSHAVLVVEATERSGTLITARLAMEYNRDVLAVPGPIHASTSKGPHRLLQQGAGLITSSEDILEALNITPKEKVHRIPLDMTVEEQRVYDILSKKPEPRDVLVQALGISTAEANTLIASLELRGLVQERLGIVEWIT